MKNECCPQNGLKTETVYRVEGDYIYFGSYPQTEVTSTMAETLSEYVNDKPSAENANGWTSYKFFKDGKEAVDFMWYKDVVHMGDKYRAVYFTSYRPVHSSVESNDNGMNSYEKCKVYWFRYDEIKWRILARNGNTLTIFSDYILDSQPHNRYSNTCNYGYADSTIRPWLNDIFYNTAFNELQKQLIDTIMVDNGETQDLSDDEPYEENTNNEHDYVNTFDKVWLLSRREVTRAAYGFSLDYTEEFQKGDVKAKKATDYARCQGVQLCNSQRNDLGNGCWWLRSFFSEFGRPHCVKGGCSDHVSAPDRTDCGIVPAMQITLKN